LIYACPAASVPVGSHTRLALASYAMFRSSASQPENSGRNKDYALERDGFRRREQPNQPYCLWGSWARVGSVHSFPCSLDRTRRKHPAKPVGHGALHMIAPRGTVVWSRIGHSRGVPAENRRPAWAHHGQVGRRQMNHTPVVLNPNCLLTLAQHHYSSRL
jgi:hypothetical protein